MKRNRIAAIDVGTSKVCTIMADTDGNDNLRILGVGLAPSNGLHKGLVVNVNEAKQSILASIRQAEQSAGYKLESAYVGVTGRHITSVNTRGAIAITRNDQLVRHGDLRRVLDIARSVKVPSEQRFLHVIPRTYMVDGNEGVKNPVGMHGFRLDVEAHIITAAATSIQNLTKCIRGAGVEIDDLIMESLASAEAVLVPEEKLDGVMLADIGGGTTDIAVYRDNTICHTSVLPVAGYQVTRDISIGLGLSYELAEEMKKKYGNVLPEDANNPAEDRTLTSDGHSISYRDLSGITRARTEEFLRLLLLELPQTDYGKFIPAGVVLTGGGANLVGIAELGQKILRLPVRIGRPSHFLGVSDVLDDPIYATGVGLLLWKMRNRHTEGWNARKSGLRRLAAQLFKVFR
jgi:cell division protein FtsA